MFLFLVTLCFQLTYVCSLDCYQCGNVQDPSSCHTLVVCPSDSLCAMESSTETGRPMFNMSCKPRQECRSSSVLSTTFSPTQLIGRRRRASANEHCKECCSKDACNKLLCTGNTHSVTSQCVDDPAFDCAHVSTFYEVCADVAHAKLACRKFCGLCDLVDGMWAIWSSWSSCDVTCGNGTTVRTRSCTDPAPAHGGTNCTGLSREHSTCQLQNCPVHGGWSGWSNWNNCSATCGLGLQTRRRTCSNPTPALYGDHCFGDSLEDKPCFLRACADGGWSGWGSWGACSATCNGGIQHRTRRCDNPGPSVLGRDCPGNNQESQACHGEICSRNSNNSYYNVLFKARNIADTSPSRFDHIQFTTNVINIGGAYNSATGTFTAPFDGVYTFTVQLCTDAQKYVDVYIKTTNRVIATVRSYDESADITCNSGDALAELKAGNQVWVEVSNTASGTVFYQADNVWNSFSGNFIH